MNGDESSHAHARAALTDSAFVPRRILDPEDEESVKDASTAIRTLRFREYRLYQQLRPNGAERPELKAPPQFPLTPVQENVLFCELERRGAFEGRASFTAWNEMRKLGFV